MASDLSNIFKEELSNTLEQLLSKSSQIEAIVAILKVDASTGSGIRKDFHTHKQ